MSLALLCIYLLLSGIDMHAKPDDQTLNEFFLTSVVPPFFNDVYTMVLGGYATKEDYYIDKCKQKLRRSAYVEVVMATDEVTDVVVEPMYTKADKMAHLGEHVHATKLNF